MPRARDLERAKRIRELRNQGLSLREISDVENVSLSTAYRALGPATASELLAENRMKALEDRTRGLEEQLTLAKDFMEIVAKMSGFLGSDFRDQLTAILRRWPQPMVLIRLAGSPTEAPKVVVVRRRAIVR